MKADELRCTITRQDEDLRRRAARAVADALNKLDVWEDAYLCGDEDGGVSYCVTFEKPIPIEFDPKTRKWEVHP